MANPRKRYVVVGATVGEYGYGQKSICEDGHATTVHASDPDKYGPTSGGGWHFVRNEWGRPIILNAEEMAAFLRVAEKTRERVAAESKTAAECKTQAQAVERACILKEYAYLEPLAGSKKSGHALAAANLRKLLKREFPGVVFSVKSDSYSGGDSVDVSWIDGPTTTEVDAFADRFQDADFDGMQDLSTYRDTVWPTVFGGAKHVMCQRRISDAAHVAVGAEMGYVVTPGAHGGIEGQDYETTEMIYREARSRSYYVRP